MTSTGLPAPFDATGDIEEDNAAVPSANSVKKKKKRTKKKASQPDHTAAIPHAAGYVPSGVAAGVPAARSSGKGKKNSADSERASVLRLARNKHWKYVSSFHGQWLSLPIEMMETLYTSNASPMPGIPIDQAHAAGPASSYYTSTSMNGSARKRRTQLDPRRNRAGNNFGQSGSRSSTSTDATSDSTVTLTIPPPVDPGVFRSLKEIRRLVDDAADLALRAASGLVNPGSPSLDLSFSNYPNGAGGGYGNNVNLNTNTNPGGRKSTLSTLRLNRMRALSVQKLAAAYRLDEVATCVMVMKGTSALEDIADKVLRHDPNNLDAQYVRFFHQKVPSSPRQLCDTTTEPLDALISARPYNLEYYRTRGVVQSFLEEYDLAIRDFTYGLVEARKARKAGRRDLHDRNDYRDHDESNGNGDVEHDSVHSSKTGAHGKRSKKKASTAVDAEQEEQSTAPANDSVPNRQNGNKLHHSLGPTAPDPLESQFLFHRASAYLAQAISTIERTVLSLEGMPFPTPESPEIRLSTLSPIAPYLSSVDGTVPYPKYGGVDLNDMLGPRNGSKWKAYRNTLGDPRLKDSITTMLRKSIRDFEKFLGHFDSLVVPDSTSLPPSLPSLPLSIPPSGVNGNSKRVLDSPTSAWNPAIPPGNGKGKEVEVAPNSAAGNPAYDYGYYYGTVSASGSVSVSETSSPSPHSPTIGKSIGFPSDLKQFKSLFGTSGPTTLSIPLPIGANTSTLGKDGLASSAIASALYEALQSQLGNSPLASALLEQLPAAAAKAIDASISHLDKTGRLGVPSHIATALPPISIPTGLPSAGGAPRLEASPPKKWKDVPLSQQVAFSFFVTDCLRATPGSLPTSTTSSSSSSGMATTTTTASSIPLSPSPELERTFPVALSTYHPLLIDAHFSILLCLLLLGDIPALLETFVRSAVSLDGADGYPVFSPARSMAQADFNEILERLCGSWKSGRAPPTKTDASSTSASASSSAGPSGSSSASRAMPAQGSSSSSSSRSLPPPLQPTHDSDSAQGTASEGLNSMRVLLDPVYKRLAHQRRSGYVKGKGMPLMLLCSPRVDVAIAWLAAIHLPTWEDDADGRGTF